MENEYRTKWQDFLSRFASDDKTPSDSWFVSLTFPIPVTKGKMEGLLKDWLIRLRQRLSLKENEFSYIDIPALQVREVWHLHLIVKAKGLSDLDKLRWEEKWRQVTGRKEVEETRFHRTFRCPGVIRRRDGKKTVVRYIRETERYSVNKLVKFVGGGSCKIRQVGQVYIGRNEKPYVCTPEGIAHYLASRHSHELSSLSFSPRR